MLSGHELADRFGAELRNAIARGAAAADLNRCYAPDVQLAAYLPGEVSNVHGRDEVARTLWGWHPGPVELLAWNVERFATADREISGIAVDVLWRDADDELHRRQHYAHLGTEGVHRHVVFSDRPAANRLPDGEPGPALRTLYASAKQRSIVTSGTSGTAMEHVLTNDDQAYVVKWSESGQDWQSRVTDDHGREVRLWREGWLDRMPNGITHPIVAAEPFGTDDGRDVWVTISRDLGPYLVRNERLSLARMRTYVSALNAMYEARSVDASGRGSRPRSWSGPPRTVRRKASSSSMLKS